MTEINFELIRWVLPVIVLLLCAGSWMAGYGIGANSATPEAVGPESDDLTIAYMAGIERGKEIAKNEINTAQDRIFDMLHGDDGQADKEARRYLERTRPDLIERLHTERKA